MSEVHDPGVAKLREALAALERDEAERVAAFNESIALLRQRIAFTRQALFLSPPTDVTAAPHVRITPLRQAQAARHPTYNPPRDLIERVRGLSQPEALVEMARYCDGVVIPREVKQVFIKAGLAKPPYKNTANHIWALLNDPDRTKRFNVSFQRIEEGVYRLVSNSEHQAGDGNQGRFPFDVA